MDGLFSHIGGKNRFIGTELVALLPMGIPDIYIEPFGGSYAVGIQSGYDPNEVIMIHNELDSIIHYIFKVVTMYPEETIHAVYELLGYYEYNQTTVDYFRFLFDYLDLTGENLLKDDIYLGAAAWILKTVTYNSNCRDLRKSGNFDPVSNVIKRFEKREEVAYMVKDILAFNMDALELLRIINKAGRIQNMEIFIYVDAPYSHSGKRKTKDNLYRVDIDKEDKDIEMLAELLEEINKNTNCKIMVSEYDNPIYKNILTEERGWEQVKVCDVQKSMSVSDIHGCKPIETEYIWRNYQ